jgi:hypothetical protein
MQDADDVLRLVAPQWNAGEARLEHGVDDVRRRIVGIDSRHLGAMDHDIGHRQVAQIEQPAHHVAVQLFDAALAVQEVDGAADLFVRREDRLLLANPHAEETQELAHQPFDRHQHWAEHADHQRHRPRRRQRHAIGRIEGDRLRQHFSEHHNEHRHQPGGIDYADVAEPHQEHAGRQRRGRNIDRVVAEQQRADQPLARRQQPVDGCRLCDCRPAATATSWRAKTRSAQSRCRRRKTTPAGRAR